MATIQKNAVSIGAVCAELVALGRRKAAAEYAKSAQRADLVEKIVRGQFSVPRTPFNAARAQARSAAMQVLAA